MTQPWIKLPDLHPFRIHSHWALGTGQIGNSLPLLRVAFSGTGTWGLGACLGSAALAHRSSFSQLATQSSSLPSLDLMS